MSSYLVTGASRGLGLELASQLSKLPQDQVSIVFAAIRTKDVPEPLQRLVDSSNGRVVPIQLPITDKAGIAAAVPQIEQKLGGSGLDVLINNAGVMPFESDGIAGMTNLGEVFKINTEGVQDTTAALLPLLKKGKQKKVINISTTLGSITQSPKYAWAPAPAYKITKAALNMLTVQWAQEYAKEGFTFLAVSPGWLKTDLGSQQADLEVGVGAKEVLRLTHETGPESTGKYLNIHVPGWENTGGPNNYDGKGVPW